MVDILVWVILESLADFIGNNGLFQICSEKISYRFLALIHFCCSAREMNLNVN